MHVLIVSHYFPPEIGAPQARLSEFARFWAEAGEQVVVLTGMPNHPTGIVPPEYRKKARVEKEVHGYRVVRTWLYATPNEGILRKTLGHLSFMFSSVALGWRKTGPADIVLASSPTFFSIFSAWFLARVKRARLVVEVRDLWPGIFVELGVLKNRLAIRLLEALELAAYRAADLVVVVSEGFKMNIVDRGIDARKVHVIRNGVDLERFDTPSPDTSARRTLGARDGEVLALYIGAHGISHGLPAIADAASIVADANVHIAFVGEGAAKRELEQRVQELELENVTLLPGVPAEEVPRLVAAADICLVPLRDIPLFDSFIPSKIFEFLAAGKPVIGSVSGESAEILQEAEQQVVRPEDAEAIARAIRELAGDPQRRADLGARGRAYVREKFDRRNLAAKYLKLLKATGASGTTSAA